MVRLLWADDQPDVAHTLASPLTGMSVEFVTSGEEAIRLMASQFFDLVLLDLAMPPGPWGGLWLLEEMRARSFFTPAIVLSGEGAQSETIKALRLGAVDYVTKENATQELAERVREALRQTGGMLDNVGGRSTADLIAGPEARRVEFKESARWDVRRGVRDSKIEHEVVKTVGGFLNTSGGTLLIGVRDNGEVAGIGPDLALFRGGRDPQDSFTNWITTLLTQAFGAADTSLIRVRLEDLAGSLLCRLDVSASPHPVFAANDEGAFFVRVENSTRKLTPQDAVQFVRNRWPS